MGTELWLRKYDDEGITMCYKAKVFTNIDWKFVSPVSPMPLPEESGDENILVKMEGNTHTVQLTFVIKNETKNAGVSNSSNSGGYDGASKSIFEQIKWMTASEDESAQGGGFIGRHLTDAYDICILENTTGLNLHDMVASSAAGTKSEFDQNLLDTTSSENPAPTVDGLALQMFGYVRNISFRTSASEPATLRGTIEFIEGNVVGGYQSKVPSRVRNFKVSTPSSGATDTRMYLTYTAPESAGATPVTHYVIAHKVSGSTDEYKLQNPSPTGSTNVMVTNLTASTEYDWKVAAQNSDGRGKFSWVRTKATTS